MKPNGTLFLLLLMSLSLLAQPPSDDCEGLIDLGQAPVCTNDIYTNVDATASNPFSDPSFNIPSCWNIINHDVWASFTVPADGSIVDFVITITGTEDGVNGSIVQPQIALYRGACQENGLAELLCAEAVLGENEVTLTAEGLTPSLTYFLRIDDVMNTATPNWGDFEICVEELVLEANITASADTLCAGTPLDISAEIMGEPTSIQWEPAFYFNTPNQANPNFIGSLFQTTTFTLTVMADDLSVTEQITIYVSSPFAFINQSADATCTGVCDGSAEVSASGSVTNQNWTYEWSNDATTASISDLCGGYYSVTVTDEVGCVAFSNVTINEADFEVNAFSTASPCIPDVSGSAIALVSGGTAPFSYSWSNSETTESIMDLSAGSYQVTVEDANGCNDTAEVEITINENGYAAEITASSEMVCAGEQVTLSCPTPPDGTTLTWSTGETGTTITVNPTDNTSYSVSSSVLTQNIIQNGDFEEGLEGFYSDYVYGYGGNWGLLSAEGTYAIDVNSSNVHNNFPSCTDHSGTGNMLVVNGSNVLNSSIWCQTLSVAPNTTYQFSTWAMTVTSGNPPILQFSIADELLGTPFDLTNFPVCEWGNFNETWDSGNNTLVEICIVNQNTANSGNDFALDDLSLIPICTSYDEIEINVAHLEASISDQSNVNCQGEAASATVTASGDAAPFFYSWDNGEDSAQATLLDAGQHQVTVSNSIGCESVVEVNIEQDPQISIDSLIVAELMCGDIVDGSSSIIAASIAVANSVGTAPFEYSIDGTNFQSSNLFDELSAGDYELTVRDANACLATANTSITDLVFPETPIISLDPTDLCSSSTGINLIVDNADVFDRLLWSTTEEGASIHINEAGDYEVFAFNELNCASKASQTIEPCGDYEIPNIFSPNGDDANEVFKIYHAQSGFEFGSLKVFNRWGQLVFETFKDEAWDGTVDGEEAPADIYIYQASFTQNGESIQESGQITLIR